VAVNTRPWTVILDQGAATGCSALKADLDARRVKAGSQIPGTERPSAVASGHPGGKICKDA
jgi:hypothetical protein